ncbi:MAG: patatin-like phospholipase family protein [Burkholderiales bacterium]|nr:patatin-like phospholipase family protein [Burkholderiales bacterium]
MSRLDPARHWPLLAAVILCLSAHVAPGHARDTNPPRPRIALALGGGGAMGAAHIGVIKVLEELRVPIDCIAGTSMGAVVGAAYATGLDAAALDRIMTSVNWKDTFESAPREDIPVRRKQLDFVFTLGLELGINDGKVRVSQGLVPTQQIENLFKRIVAGARQTNRFADLPIPFKAVATDIESGDMVVLDHGDLTQAMRASMAVPGAFAPVELDGRLLVDGMFVRNLPIDVARRTCGDVVIAVSVGNPPPKRGDLTDALAVLGRAAALGTELNEKTQLETLTARDVAIKVVLDGINATSFDRIPEAIPIGETAARNLRAQLARYSLPANAYAAWRAGLGDVSTAALERIDEVRIEGTEHVDPEVLRNFISLKAGDLFDPQKASADTTRLVGRGDFDNVDFRMTEEAGRNVLTYTVREKSIGTNTLLFDLNVQTDFEGDTRWGIRVDQRVSWVNRLGGEWRNTLQVGVPTLLASEFYQPLDEAQRYFVAPRVYYSKTYEDLFVDEQRVARLDVERLGVAADVGMALGTWGEWRLGLERGRADLDIDIGTPLASGGRVSIGLWRTRFEYDQLDQAIFPTRGSYGLVDYYESTQSLGADDNYRKGQLKLRSVVSRGRNVFEFGLRGGSDFGSATPVYDQFVLGGLNNFSGYQIGELRGREYVLGTTRFRRRIFDLTGTLGTGVYLGGGAEVGNVYERLDRSDSSGVIWSGSAYLIVDSKLGPLYVGAGFSEGGRVAGYLYIGSSFDVFAR